jgi:hypothetical protein
MRKHLQTTGQHLHRTVETMRAFFVLAIYRAKTDEDLKQLQEVLEARLYEVQRLRFLRRAEAGSRV